jgi:hypothetical protein|nr:MAG TPA: hypothetical protein [Caudoviricetes sp.]
MKNYRDVKEGSLRDYFRGIDGEVNIQVEQVGDNYMLNQIRIKDYRNIDFTQDNHLALMNLTDNIKVNDGKALIYKVNDEIRKEGDFSSDRGTVLEFKVAGTDYQWKRVIGDILTLNGKANGNLGEIGAVKYSDELGLLTSTFISNNIIIYQGLSYGILRMDWERALGSDEYREIIEVARMCPLVFEDGELELNETGEFLELNDHNIQKLKEKTGEVKERIVSYKNKQFGGKFGIENLELAREALKLTKDTPASIKFEIFLTDGTSLNDVQSRWYDWDTTPLTPHNGVVKVYGDCLSVLEMKLSWIVENVSKGEVFYKPEKFGLKEREWVKKNRKGHIMIDRDKFNLPDKLVEDWVKSKIIGVPHIPDNELVWIGRQKKVETPDTIMITPIDIHQPKSLSFYLSNQSKTLITREKLTGSLGDYSVYRLNKKNYEKLLSLGFMKLEDFIESNEDELSKAVNTWRRVLDIQKDNNLIQLKFREELLDEVFDSRGKYEYGMNYLKDLNTHPDYQWIDKVHRLVVLYGCAYYGEPEDRLMREKVFNKLCADNLEFDDEGYLVGIKKDNYIWK